MPVPLSVMQAAVQGDKKAIRLVEQEYGVGDGRRYAENYLSEEEPPPEQIGAKRSAHLIEESKTPELDYSLKDLISSTTPYKRTEYQEQAKKQVKEGEAKILAEKLSRLKKKSDIQDVLLKVAGEDYALAQSTATLLKISGGTLLGIAAGLTAPGSTTALDSVAAGTALSVPGAYFGLLSKGPSDFKSNAANKKFADIELSPEAQTIYDEYKTLGYSPTYYKTK